ncbi:pentatricopeptide repeat-containing protein At1g05750, chloroplastic-like [Mangifera indica]|uniref:pentatricopeptide repeat-containing protein At1g05750, chloroplastic-like n=1 Tax=Mangifera indica TaxID=29780 RepID=UPI001CFB35F1|nr:pentatricopeptide repeat-containing protein At1g05750, chloroplastic-like [Mangifera indica]
MISGLMRIGRVSEARKVFDEMPERDVASWSAMVSGYSQCGVGVEALRVFRDMVEAMVIPNLPGLVSAVSACAQLRALDEGVWLHDYIVKSKFEIDVTLGTVLLDMYGRCGCIERAVEVFNCMPEKNVLSWNLMIAGLAMNGHSRLVDEGLRLFGLMTQKYKIEPQREHYGCVVDLLGLSNVNQESDVLEAVKLRGS